MSWHCKYKQLTPDENFTIRERDILHSEASSSSYSIIGFLGEGTFGRAAHCVKLQTNEHFAVKVVKKQQLFARAAQAEAGMLGFLRRYTSEEELDRYRIVRFFETFVHDAHNCMVFELLGKNLFEYMAERRHEPMRLGGVRAVAVQLVLALKKLGELGVIHADLKPENIVLAAPPVEGVCFVKVIDLGSAAAREGRADYLQSRYYRAPEVLMGCRYGAAIDMWSLGCVLAELYLGYPLYPGAHEYDQMRYILKVQGALPPNMFADARRASRFFTRSKELRTFNDYCTERRSAGAALPKPAKTFDRLIDGLKTLDDIVCVTRKLAPRVYNSAAEVLDRREFLRFVKSSLELDPVKRLTPDGGLWHPFIRMTHFAEVTSAQRLLYVRQAGRVMEEVCGGERWPKDLPPLPKMEWAPWKKLASGPTVENPWWNVQMLTTTIFYPTSLKSMGGFYPGVREVKVAVRAAMRPVQLGPPPSVVIIDDEDAVEEYKRARAETVRFEQAVELPAVSGGVKRVGEVVQGEETECKRRRVEGKRVEPGTVVKAPRQVGTVRMHLRSGRVLGSN